MAKTGGPLDHLCSKHGLGAVSETIPIMKVIGVHKPTTEEEVIKLIDSHNGKFCRECKCKGNGNLEDWGERMYQTQKEDEEWRTKMKLDEEYPFTQEECVEWFKQLFVVAPLVGIRFEKQCLEQLDEWLVERFEVREASRYTDTRYGVDIEIGSQQQSSGNRYRTQFSPICGIQVKSKVYKNARKGVKEGLLRRHRQYPYPVFFMYYDEEKDCLHGKRGLHKKLYDRYPWVFNKP